MARNIHTLFSINNAKMEKKKKKKKKKKKMTTNFERFTWRFHFSSSEAYQILYLEVSADNRNAIEPRRILTLLHVFPIRV